VSESPPAAVPATLEPLLAAFRAGKRGALGRAISLVENEGRGFQELLHAVLVRGGGTGAASLEHPPSGLGARRLGVTGPPGAGKSTLLAALAGAYRRSEERVGVVAVDPTSPFSGGALLGDRIRMNDLATDPGIFIRSMATRGSLGGLALATKEVADVMDAFGFDRILVETVGVGQSELDIAAAADSTVVVLVPESGDAIQAMKAGLMEAADLFVINKSDRPGADRLAREISMMLHLRTGRAMRNVPAHHGVDLKRIAKQGRNTKAAAATSRAASTSSASHTSADAAITAWEIPVLQTVADSAKGVPELAHALAEHRDWLAASGELSRRRRQRLAERVREEVGRALALRVWEEQGGAASLEAALPELESGTATPYEVAARIVRALGA
jgi:LAO/AO transport system kinase